MDRRLQCTMALLFLLFIHSTAALEDDDNMTISYVEHPTECFYNQSSSGRFTVVNVSLTAPGIHTGNYESIVVATPGQKVTKDVIIYWENYLKCRDIVQFHYKAFYLKKTTRGGGLVKIFADVLYTNYAIFTELRHDIAYNFEVVSIDSNNASDVSIIYVPSDTDKTKPNKPLWVKNKQIMADLYMLEWENPRNQQSVRYHRSNQYTVHWCENEPNSLAQCNGKMYTLIVPITQSRCVIKVENRAKSYQFAVSAEMVNYSAANASIGSGLQWEECSVLRNPRREVIIIKKIWITSVGSTYIGLRWKIDCNTMSDYFAAFQIYYCPVVSVKIQKCQEKLALKFIGKYNPVNNLPHAVLPNLKPGTLYMFSVDILTRVDNRIGVMFRTVLHFQRTRQE